MSKTIPYRFVTFLLLVSLFACSTENNEQTSRPEDGACDILDDLAKSPDKTVVSSQNTVRPVNSPLNEVSLSGYIAPDERRTNKITARFGGRIERLYVKYPWQYVNKRTKLLDVYSPELNTYAEEYLYLQQRNDTMLLPQAREKLLLLGLTDAQIGELEKSGTIPFSTTIYAPQNGFILPGKNSSPSAMNPPSGAQNQGGMNMGTGGNPVESSRSVSVASGWLREGMYIDRDQVLFAMNDLVKVWGMALGNAVLLSQVETGDSAAVYSEQLPGKAISAVVDFLEPYYERGQKFTRVRFYIDNPGHALQINSLFQATIQTGDESTLTLPASAVLDLGKRRIVWVKTGQCKDGQTIFKTREVTTGAGNEERISILSGLEPDEEVAKHAGMLLDRETLVK